MKLSTNVYNICDEHFGYDIGVDIGWVWDMLVQSTGIKVIIIDDNDVLTIWKGATSVYILNIKHILLGRRKILITNF